MNYDILIYLICVIGFSFCMGFALALLLIKDKWEKFMDRTLWGD
jgi:hypothetical protein